MFKYVFYVMCLFVFNVLLSCEYINIQTGQDQLSLSKKEIRALKRVSSVFGLRYQEAVQEGGIYFIHWNADRSFKAEFEFIRSYLNDNKFDETFYVKIRQRSKEEREKFYTFCETLSLKIEGKRATEYLDGLTE